MTNRCLDCGWMLPQGDKFACHAPCPKWAGEHDSSPVMTWGVVSATHNCQAFKTSDQISKMVKAEAM